MEQTLEQRVQELTDRLERISRVVGLYIAIDDAAGTPNDSKRMETILDLAEPGVEVV